MREASFGNIDYHTGSDFNQFREACIVITSSITNNIVANFFDDVRLGRDDGDVGFYVVFIVDGTAAVCRIA